MSRTRHQKVGFSVFSHLHHSLRLADVTKSKLNGFQNGCHKENRQLVCEEKAREAPQAEESSWQETTCFPSGPLKHVLPKAGIYWSSKPHVTSLNKRDAQLNKALSKDGRLVKKHVITDLEAVIADAIYMWKTPDLKPKDHPVLLNLARRLCERTSWAKGRGIEKAFVELFEAMYVNLTIAGETSN